MATKGAVPSSYAALRPHTVKGSPKDAGRDKVALSARHAAFIDHYFLSFNATKAAKAAGYSPRSAGQIGHALLKKHEIAAEISRRRHAMAEDMADIRKERVEYELMSVGLSNMQDMIPMLGDGTPNENLRALTRTQAAAVKRIVIEEFKDARSDHRTVRRTKFELHDKTRALELVSKMRGWVSEKQNHEHARQGLILHEILKDISAAQEGKPIVDVTSQIENDSSE
jgi:phage terminase small subunit